MAFPALALLIGRYGSTLNKLPHIEHTIVLAAGDCGVPSMVIGFPEKVPSGSRIAIVTGVELA
jgi:hypothetical protein